MKLSIADIQANASAWEAAGIALPKFDVAAMRAATAAAPEWVHFGAGNIFRGFIGSLAQRLLDEGLMRTGILACDTFDHEVIDRIYGGHDSLTLMRRTDGTLLPCERIAQQAGTISYEILCGISKRIPRIYMQDGREQEILQYIV